jgi:L-sorbose 1-phosphate reductase
MELSSLSDFKKKGKTDSFFIPLSKIVEENNGLWSEEAEKYLLENAKSI